MTRRPGTKQRHRQNAMPRTSNAKITGSVILGAAAVGVVWSTPWLGRGLAVVLPRWWAQVAAGAAVALLGLWAALLMQRRPIGGPVPHRPQAAVTALYLLAFLCMPLRQVFRDQIAYNGIVNGGFDFVVAMLGTGVLCAGVWLIATRRVRKARHDREIADWEALRRDPKGVARQGAARRAKSGRAWDPGSDRFGAADIALMFGAPVAAVAALMIVGVLN